MKAVVGMLGFVVAAYFIALLATLPADRAYAWLRPSIPGVETYGLSGTLWSGKAERVVAGNVELPPLRWQWRPSGLLNLAIEYQLRFGRSPLTGAAVVGMDWRQQPVLRRVDIPAAMLAPYLGPLAPPLGGRITADAATLRLREPVEIQAEAQWTGAGLGWEPPVLLGDLSLNLESEDGGVRGELTNQGGDVGVEGLFALVGGGLWTLKGSLQPRSRTDQRLTRLLANLGRPDGRGGVIFQQQGRLPL